MTQPDRGDSGHPLTGVILVLVMTVGAFWVRTVPLPSARPPEAPVSPERYAAQQNIDARLWQDPFEAVKKNAPKPDLGIEAVELSVPEKKGAVHFKGTAKTQPGSSTGGNQQDICAGKSVERQVLILAAMVSGAPYAEAGEERRRTRYAVVSGLARRGYEPEDRAHIGRITADVADPPDKQQSVEIPFEWFEQADRKVLVLWINETLIRNHPINGLRKIVEKACSCVQKRETVVIGPSSSDTLRAMMIEVNGANKDAKAPPGQSKKSAGKKKREVLEFLKDIQIISPRATAPDGEILGFDFLRGLRTCSPRATAPDGDILHIRPSRSDILGEMKIEVQKLDKPERPKQSHGFQEFQEFQEFYDFEEFDFLRGLRICSPKATAPDGATLQGAVYGVAGSDLTVKDWLAQQVSGLKFHRTIATDSVLVKALVEELRIRLVKSDDGIVLISEWDTSYGRALPKAFDEVIQSKDGSTSASTEFDFLNRLKGKLVSLVDWVEGKWVSFVDWLYAIFGVLKETEPERIPDPTPTPDATLWHFSYLRGLDGILPGDGADKKVEDGKKPREKEDAAIESAFGNHQKDYLRRIAARVADLDQRLKNDGKNEGVKAIGILGSDVYDKLLILRALRPRFPEVIFFTTDLDARLLHNEEWPFARNLVVASSYGLRLNGWLQKEIPPFRDSYQTAYFLSVLAALLEGDEQRNAMVKIEKWNSSSRLFEIGRSQPVDLSDTIKDDDKCDLATCNSPHPYAEPPNRSRFASIAWLALLLLLLLLPVVWYLHRKAVADFLREAWADINLTRKQTGFWYGKTLRLPNRWVLGLAVTLLFVLWLGFQGWSIWKDLFITGTAGGGEPFSWYEGVSIWPSVFLRAFTGLLALYLLLCGMHRLRKNDEELTRDFFGDVPTILEPLPLRAVQHCRSLSGRLKGARPQSGSPQDNFLWLWLKGEWPKCDGTAVNIWRDTVQPRSRVALFWRLVAGVVLLFLTMVLLWSILSGELPNTPSRGDLSYRVNRCVLFFAILSFLFLLVFVIDSIRRTCRLATRLSKPTRWPAVLEGKFGCAGAPHCDDWLDIQLIAARTAVVSGFIYYPFVILSLLILARSSIFDNWQIPASLWLIFVLYLAIALACATSLRHAAERARRHALANLTRHIVAAIGKEERRQQVEQMKLMKEEIQAEHRGAFSSFLSQPGLKAVLLPLGSYSGIQLIEYLSLLNL